MSSDYRKIKKIRQEKKEAKQLPLFEKTSPNRQQNQCYKNK
jgi:hypothetical protein